MSFDKRYYPKNKQLPLNIQYDKFNREHQYFYLRFGVIEDIDLDRYLMRISWYERTGAVDNIPITFPYIGPKGCIGVFPEKGSVGIFGFFNTGLHKGQPILIGYLPKALSLAYDYGISKTLPDSIPSDELNEIEYQFRKMTVGDATIKAPNGAYVFLNRNVEISDDSMDSILIKSDEQSIIQTSLNNFISTSGILVSMGPVIRNSAILYDSEGKKVHNYGSVYSLYNGKENIYIVPYGDEINHSTEYYAEYRIDACEITDGRLNLNDINSALPLSSDDPIITMVLGNYIGADKKNHLLYSYPLKLRLFSNPNDKIGSFTLERAYQNAGIDEPSVLGFAYALHLLKNDAFFGFDKEGHCYLHLPASQLNPLGAGRSMSILAKGNLKEIWGHALSDGNSWDLSTSGGIKWNVGIHNETSKNRSIEIKTKGGIYIEAGSNDTDDSYTRTDGTQLKGIAKHEVIKGNAVEEIQGDKLQYLNNLEAQITGLKIENIMGSSSETVQSDKGLNILGNFSEVVVNKKQSKYGSQKTTIVNGDTELEVLKGNIKETISTFGKRTINVLSGNIEQTITTGDYKTTITAGNYKVTVSAGNIEIKTSAGSINLTGTNIKIKGDLSVSIDSSIVKVGSGAPFGGAVTGLPGSSPSHNDYITGAPLKGSVKVGIA